MKTMIIIAASLFFSFSSFAQSVVCYEGNYCTQDIICRITFSSEKTFISLKDTTLCGGDEIRSVSLSGFRQGQYIYFYDSPTGNPTDDYCKIYVKSHLSNYKIGTLEHSYSDSYVEVTFHHVNGLDGKVSAIELGHAGTIKSRTPQKKKEEPFSRW